MHSSEQLIHIFAATFFSTFATRLQGGADEPYYSPVKEYAPVTENGSDESCAVIYFRDNFISSALHEISHWVIAGEQRRALPDYGYWYEADDRDLEKQKKFETVEIKPQAIECLFHLAAGLPFQVSVDNLSLPDYDRRPFERLVEKQVYAYCSFDESKALVMKMPKRAYLFIQALLAYRNIQCATEKQVLAWLNHALH
ncbi:hypothetical protein CBF23_008020 [Marinomonas agarivorans]|nr:hypothetical protein CBF23_008020 [Marinomonas agarivorans]